MLIDAARNAPERPQTKQGEGDVRIGQTDPLNASQGTTEPTCTRSWREPDCESTKSGN